MQTLSTFGRPVLFPLINQLEEMETSKPEPLNIPFLAPAPSEAGSGAATLLTHHQPTTGKRMHPGLHDTLDLAESSCRFQGKRLV